MLTEKHSAAEISEMALTPQGRAELHRQMEWAAAMAKLIGNVLDAIKEQPTQNGWR